MARIVVEALRGRACLGPKNGRTRGEQVEAARITGGWVQARHIRPIE